MKIKDKIIITMDQPEAMQEDGYNWIQEEMVDAAIGLLPWIVIAEQWC